MAVGWLGRGGVGREPAPAADFLSLGAADLARLEPFAHRIRYLGRPQTTRSESSAPSGASPIA